MQKTMPDILITNTSMLSTMLVRGGRSYFLNKPDSGLSVTLMPIFISLSLDELHLQREEPPVPKSATTNI